MIDIQREVVTALVIAGIYLLVFLIGEMVRRLIPSNAEISRKAVHLLGGLIAISFPYLFISHWTVLALSVSFCAIVLITKNKGVLKSVHDIERKSYGGICYPAAIYLIFLLSSAKPVIYFISILVMAVSDPMAALVGRKYGVIKFDVEGNLKSIEDSIAFFCVTFLCVHLPLLLLTNIGRTESVLIALITALLVTGFEAISLFGSDNIIVPFVTYFILAKLIEQPLNVVVWQIELLLTLIAAGTIMYIPLRLSKASGLIVMIMLNYAALSLCSFHWFLPLFLSQILYYLLILSFVYYEGKEKVASFQVKVLLYIGVIPAFFLFVVSTNKDHIYVYLPYLTSITAQLAIICNYYFANYISRPLKADNYLKHHGKVLGIFCSIIATFFIAGMPIYFYKTNHRLNSLIIVAVGTWVAYVLNFTMNNYYRSVKDGIFDYRWRFVSATIGVAFVVLLQKFISL